MKPTQSQSGFSPKTSERFERIDSLFDEFMDRTEKYYKGSVQISTFKGHCAGMSMALAWKKGKIEEADTLRGAEYRLTHNLMDGKMIESGDK